MSAILPLVLLAIAAIELARVIAAYRRAVRLNRALHELRRPLQSISLSIEGDQPDVGGAGACLEQARRALEELDAVVNRRRLVRTPVRAALGQITGSLEDRWRFAGVRVSAPLAGRSVEGDPVALGAALDNLVANAVEHGGGEVSVRALPSRSSVRFEVRDDGSKLHGPGDDLGRGEPDPRRGHGLAIAAAIAAEHGGTLIAPTATAGGGAVTALSLPVPSEERAAR